MKGASNGRVAGMRVVCRSFGRVSEEAPPKFLVLTIRYPERLCLKNQLARYRAPGFIHTWLQPGAAERRDWAENRLNGFHFGVHHFHLAEARCE